MTSLTRLFAVTMLGAMVALAGCSKEVDESGDSHSHSDHDHDHDHDHAHDGHDHDHDHGEPSPELAAVVLTSGAPAEAIGVTAARDNSQSGQDVTVEGKLKDFVTNKAAFTLVDGSIKSCADTEGDACKTPWDYCCVAPEKLKTNMATVKLVNAEGKLLDGNLEGVNKLDHLTTVVVSGKTEKDESGNLTIVASNVYIK